MNEVIFDGFTVGSLLILLGGGLGVSVVAQVIKRVFKLTNSDIIQFLVVALSGVTTGLGYIISALHGSLGNLVPHAASILGIANASHTWLVSRGDAFIQKVRKALNDEEAPPTIPVGTSTMSVSAPTTPPTTPTPDF